MNFISTVLVDLILALPLVGAYALFALGIVVIYRASRVLNLAHGAMATVPAYVAFTVGSRLDRALEGVLGGIPFGLGTTLAHLPAVAVGIASGGVIGVLVERFVVRRLRSVSATAQTVGTVAVFGLLVALTARVWGTQQLTGISIVPHHSFTVGFARVSTEGLALFVVAGLSAAGFFALFRYTSLGLAMQLAADNRRAAALMGIDPERTTSYAWLIGGLFAGLGGSLLAAATALDPYILSLSVLPAFVAALIGGLDSAIGALAGSLIVGLAIGLVPSLVALQPGPHDSGPLAAIGGAIAGLASQDGADKLVLALLAFLIMGMRGGRFQASDVRSGLG